MKRAWQHFPETNRAKFNWRTWYGRDQQIEGGSFPGFISLFVFAYQLTRVEASFAGRAYAAYDGIYIAASLLWLWLVERLRSL